ncbi:sugar transferase (PEP-CTERM/EpsH1 system associated) [Plasticicumulans acidivorans]|uniref:Sugar transferase (PEP-CTERM/EpsH1 system associated) n=2 Tax=Plasticicumulans acidivorans TaxID=886464 RepID=A0A317MZJ5_9GAMM|nr:TIGR03088 family PEP-CTERM/XrtA system glycosyltransferase [Plasticicumulans acidivorans]PWV65722.1 sugar transferase (PEP-CTERM/EpsH1 system associated) [Plasticicumulans acidivorans]
MAAPLIAHVVHRLTVGGLENGVVNLINHMPVEHYRHAVICLTDHTDFAQRIRRPDVELIDLHKHPGQDLGLYRRLLTTLRRLRPAIVHTRNVGTQEALAVAWAARVPGRVHGEHGWNGPGPQAEPPSRHRLRRWLRPFVGEYIALGGEIERYLQQQIGVPAAHISRIYNGVDTERFHAGDAARRALLPAGFVADDSLVIGTVGRMQNVKDQPTLARAFVELLGREPAARARLRLLMIGAGELRGEVEAILTAAGARELAWLPGERADVPELLRALDVFVLPSRAEGVSNTILEAMATALPVVATDVGAAAELLIDGETGMLVPPAAPGVMAEAIAAYLDDAELRRRHGQAGRARIESSFSMAAMVERYLAVYERALARA